MFIVNTPEWGPSMMEELVIRKEGMIYCKKAISLGAHIDTRLKWKQWLIH